MLSGGTDTALAMAAAACMKQARAVQSGRVGDEAAVFVSSAEAKAPCKQDEGASVVAPLCSKSKSRDALLQLLSNKSGVPPAAQRMALNILLKLARPAPDRLDAQLFSKVLCALMENEGSVSVDCLPSKCLVYGDTRCCALERIHQVAMRITKGETRGLELLKVMYDYLLLVKDPLLLASARLAALESEQKAERDKPFLEQITSLLPKTLHEPGDDNPRNARVLEMPQLTFSAVDEQTADRCKASVPDNALQEPEKRMSGKDMSALVATAARGRGNETNSGSTVKAGNPTKKKVSGEDEVDEDDEEDGGGGDSGGDEGDSDDPDHGANEEDEDGEEEEEEEDGEEEDEDDGVPAVGSNARSNAGGNNATNANNSNVVSGGDGGLGFDEEEEEESDQDGGVEDDGDGDDGDGAAEDDEGDDGEEEDEEEDGAPPKKKTKK